MLDGPGAEDTDGRCTAKGAGYTVQGRRPTLVANVCEAECSGPCARLDAGYTRGGWVWYRPEILLEMGCRLGRFNVGLG